MSGLYGCHVPDIISDTVPVPRRVLSSDVHSQAMISNHDYFPTP